MLKNFSINSHKPKLNLILKLAETINDALFTSFIECLEVRLGYFPSISMQPFRSVKVTLDLVLVMEPMS